MAIIPANSFGDDSLLFPQLKSQDSQTIGGNWVVTLSDKEDKVLRQQHIVMTTPSKQYCEPVEEHICNYRVTDDPNGQRVTGYYGDGNIYPRGHSFSGPGSLEYQHSYGIIGHWGADSKVTFSKDRGVGRWAYGDESGKEVWTRLRPKINKITFTSVESRDGKPVSSVAYGATGRVTGVFDARNWGPANDMRGNRPRFNVTLYGENLWGHHIVDIKKGIGLEPTGCGSLNDEKSKNFTGHIGLSCTIVVWPGASRGIKVLRLDNLEIPFDFDITGLAEQKQRYIIGDIKTTNTRPELMKRFDKSQLEGEIAANNRRIVEIDKDIKKLMERGRELIDKEQIRLKPYKDALEAASNPVKSNSKPTAEYNERAFRISEAKSKNFHLFNAHEEANYDLSQTPEKAVLKRQALEMKVSDAKIKLLENQAQLDRDLNDQLADDVKSGAAIDRDAYIKASDAYQSERHITELRYRSLDDEFDIKEKIKFGYIEENEKLKMKISEHEIELLFLSTRGNIVLEQISTEHADVYFNFDFRQFKEINKSISETARALKAVTDEREMARQQMIDAVDHADNSANAKIFAGYVSAISQASLDALMQIKDVAEAGAKGGPPAALAEAIHKIAFNSMDWAVSGGPKIYDGDPHHAWYDVSGTKTGKEIAADIAKKSKARVKSREKDKTIENVVGKVSKTIAGYLKEGIQLDLQELQLKKMHENLPQKEGGSRSMSTFLHNQFSQQLKDVGESKEKWNDRTMKTSVGGFTSRFLQDQLKGKIEGEAVDNVKKQLAQMLESGPMRDYLNAQVAVARSVDKFRKLGDIYWDQKVAHHLLKKHKQKLLKGVELREKTNIVLKKNEKFKPEAGYRFSLFFTDREYTEQIHAEVWVAGKQLNKGKTPNAYEMNAELAKYLKDTKLPEKLPIEIKIH